MPPLQWLAVRVARDLSEAVPVTCAAWQRSSHGSCDFHAWWSMWPSEMLTSAEVTLQHRVYFVVVDQVKTQLAFHAWPTQGMGNVDGMPWHRLQDKAFVTSRPLLCPEPCIVQS